MCDVVAEEESGRYMENGNTLNKRKMVGRGRAKVHFCINPAMFGSAGLFVHAYGQCTKAIQFQLATPIQHHKIERLADR